MRELKREREKVRERDMVNDQVVGIQALVFSVALRVLQHVQQELGGLQGPSAQAHGYRKNLRIESKEKKGKKEG